jgi:hypothetical protein
MPAPHTTPAFERHHSDSDADCTMQTVGAEEEEKSMTPTSTDAPLSSVPHLHLDSAEDDAASVGADLLSPCTLGVLPTAAASSSAAVHGVGQVLPAIAGVGDVKRISGATMSRLLRGEFRGSGANEVDEFIVIDCRYDYEYAGGHSQFNSNTIRTLKWM